MLQSFTSFEESKYCEFDAKFDFPCVCLQMQQELYSSTEVNNNDRPFVRVMEFQWRF